MMTSNRNREAAIITTIATVVSRFQMKIMRPTTNKMTATSSRAGIAEMKAEACQMSQDSRFAWRRTMFSLWGEFEMSHERYSRIHCFAMIPRTADARLKMRLTDQSAFTHRAKFGASNGDGGAGEKVLFISGGVE